MKNIFKYLLLYIIFNLFELIVNLTFEILLEEKIVEIKIIVPMILIKIFYGWIYFVPLLVSFKLCLRVVESKFLKNKVVNYILIGIIINLINYFFSKTTVFTPLILVINGMLFGFLYYLLFPSPRSP